MIRRHGLLVLFCGLLGAAMLRDALDDWVDRTALPPLLSEASVEVRDRQGALLRIYPVEGGRLRLPVRAAEVDPDFLKMLIAYEDKRFYQHRGVDLLAASRATVQALRAGRLVSGGSTLTMQAARLIENSGTGKWAGKLRQIRLALALERRLDKEDILSLYLTHAPYGGPLEGVRAGALAWFGKEPSRLSASEAALLVALPQSPETRRPDRHPDTARAARTRVLQRVGSVEAAHQAAIPTRMRSFTRLAPHLADHLRAEEPLRQRHDTTVDARLQESLSDLLRRAVRSQPRGVSAALVAADHRTGAVLASIGSPAYSAEGGQLGFVDMTRAIRSPGSTLKPFIYALAFDQGLGHPDTLIDDLPVAFGRYAPQNFDGQFRGQLSLREALQLSLNIPPVLLLQELGPSRLLATLRQGGAAPQLPGGAPGLAIALGGMGMTLTDLVQLYGGLANGGVVQPLALRPENLGGPGRRILSRSAAWQVGHVLASIAPPAGVAANNHRIAYKTGTSYGHRDAWAIGFDGAHVIGVWLGRPDGTPVPGAFGGDLAAPLLFEAFGRVKPARTPMPPPPPETLLSGQGSLPLPLRRFRSRDAVFAKSADAPQVKFPPDGAALRVSEEGVPLKVRSGVLPLTVLIDGAPHLTNLRQRDVILPLTGVGYSRISVVDAQGRADSVQVRLDQRN